jgi:hypothetical protein
MKFDGSPGEKIARAFYFFSITLVVKHVLVRRKSLHGDRMFGCHVSVSVSSLL